MSLQPTGHQPIAGSGLQQHSIGGIYPRVAVYYPFTRTWRIMEANGTYSKEYPSYDAAVESVIQ